MSERISNKKADDGSSTLRSFSGNTKPTFRSTRVATGSMTSPQSSERESPPTSIAGRQTAIYLQGLSTRRESLAK